MIEATCHCQSVCWTFEGEPESATSCNCTLCRRWGALWAYGYKDEEIRINGQPGHTFETPKLSNSTSAQFAHVSCIGARLNRVRTVDDTGRLTCAWQIPQI